MVTPRNAVSVFFSYAHEDELLRLELEKHLSLLQREGFLSTWHNRRIAPGADWAKIIDEQLNAASIILLLISADFLASDYCYGVEMRRALERHENGEAYVIPVLLRPVDLQNAPFAHLQSLPSDKRPVTNWPTLDKAFQDVAIGIRIVVEHLHDVDGVLPLPPLPTFPLSSRVSRNNREQIIKRVREKWVKGVLEESLKHTAPIKLRLHEQPDAFVNSWSSIEPQTEQSERPLPIGTRISQVYYDADGKLLVLGEAGAGKTTLLLELARDLLDYAEQDETHPIPVVFNLSSWAVKQQPLAAWLVEELNDKYQITHKVGQTWVDAHELLLLLDGLDEVADAQRSACVEAINAYQRVHDLVPVVVCSRKAEYFAQTTRIKLNKAIVVQPLNAQQIDTYLSRLGKPLEAVRATLRDDAELREMVDTPFMLSIVTSAYHGKTLNDLAAIGSFEMRRRQVFKTYVDKSLSLRRLKKRYTPEQTIRWLKYLAEQLLQHSQEEFYLERIQPDWLQGKPARRFSYSLSTRLTMALFAGLIGGFIMLVFSLSISLLTTRLTQGIVAAVPSLNLPNNLEILGLLISLIVGSVIGLSTGLLHRQSDIKPAEVLHWKWRSMGHKVKTDAFLIGGLLTWLLFGLLFGLCVWLFCELAIFVLWPTGASLFDGLFAGLVIALSSALLILVFGLALWPIGGIISEYVARSPHPLLGQQIQLKPKEKIRGSGRKQKSLLLGITSGLVCGPVCGLLTAVHLAFILALIPIIISQKLLPPDFLLVVELVMAGLVLVVTLLTGLASGLFIAHTYHVETTLKPLQALVRLWGGMIRELVTNEVLRRGILTSLVLFVASGLSLPFYWQHLAQFFSLFNIPILLADLSVAALDTGLFLAWIFALVRAITRGLSSDELDTKKITKPNQGIRRSVRNSIAVGLVSLLSSLLLFTCLGVLAYGLPNGLLGTQIPQPPNGLLCTSMPQQSNWVSCLPIPQKSDGLLCVIQSSHCIEPLQLNGLLCLPVSQQPNEWPCLPMPQKSDGLLCLPVPQQSNGLPCLPMSQKSNGLLCTPVSQQSNWLSCTPKPQTPNELLCMPNVPLCTTQLNWLLFTLLSGAILGLYIGQIIGLVAGLENGLFYGGAAFIQHRVLRLHLWSAGSIPKDYVRFLDYAHERVLLHKVGGGYMFRHPLLREYFASLEVSSPFEVGQKDQTRQREVCQCGYRDDRVNMSFCPMCGKSKM